MDYAGTGDRPVAGVAPTSRRNGGEDAPSMRVLPRPPLSRPRLAVVPAAVLSIFAHAAALVFVPGWVAPPRAVADRDAPLVLRLPMAPASTQSDPVPVPTPITPVAPPLPVPARRAEPARVAPERISADSQRPSPRPARQLEVPAAPPVVHAESPSTRMEPRPSLEVEPAPRAAEPTPVADTAVASAPAPAVPPPLPSQESPQVAALGDAPRVRLPHHDVAYLDNPRPVYPPAARRLRLEGLAVVRALISTAGTVGELRIERSSGSDLLDDAALRAVQGWRFVPAQRGSEVIAHWVDVPIQFRLGD